MQHVYVFDIDGTLADITHRLHFIQGEKKDWDAFFAACIDDAPIGHMLDLAWYIGKDHHVVYVIRPQRCSSRSDAAMARGEHGTRWATQHATGRKL